MSLPGAPKPAEKPLLADAPDLGSLPAQAEELTREIYTWVRDDSLGALAGVAVGIGLYFLFILVRGVARRRLPKVPGGTWRWLAVKVLSRTRSFFLVLLAARLVVALFAAPDGVQRFVLFLFTIAAVMQGAIWVRELLISLVEQKSAERAAADGTMSSAVGVLTVIINILVWAIAGIILLDNLGVNVTGLVAGLGIGGIAIGLAAQGIFSDLFAALSILLDRPFNRGDWIQVGGSQGVVGQVEHIGLKTTRLRALSGEIVVLSNANLLNQQINNFAQFERRRVSMLIEVIYQTDPGQLAAIPDVLRAIVNAVPKCHFDRAHIVEFAASAINFELVFFIDDPEMLPMLDARHAVAIAIVRRFAELGIDFAYPSQTSFLAGADGRIVEPHPDQESSARPAHLGRRPRKAAPTAAD